MSLLDSLNQLRDDVVDTVDQLTDQVGEARETLLEHKEKIYEGALDVSRQLDVISHAARSDRRITKDENDALHRRIADVEQNLGAKLDAVLPRRLEGEAWLTNQHAAQSPTCPTTASSSCTKKTPAYGVVTVPLMQRKLTEVREESFAAMLKSRVVTLVLSGQHLARRPRRRRVRLREAQRQREGCGH